MQRRGQFEGGSPREVILHKKGEKVSLPMEQAHMGRKKGALDVEDPSSSEGWRQLKIGGLKRKVGMFYSLPKFEHDLLEEKGAGIFPQEGGGKNQPLAYHRKTRSILPQEKENLPELSAQGEKKYLGGGKKAATRRVFPPHQTVSKMLGGRSPSPCQPSKSKEKEEGGLVRSGTVGR